MSEPVTAYERTERIISVLPKGVWNHMNDSQMRVLLFHHLSALENSLTEENKRLRVQLEVAQLALVDIRDRVLVVRDHEPYEMDIIRFCKEALQRMGGEAK